MHRLAQRPDEWIDRTRGGAFLFEGRSVPFHAGDTWASALAAAGIATTGRSFKYHRRRGLYSARNHDANTLLQVDGRPNQRADALLARDGAVTFAVNTAGGLERDRAAHVQRLARFLPVGFYYKAFIGRRAFPRFESLIRRFSGLGRVESGRASKPPLHRNLHCDVAVIGAGLSGLSAALAAAQAGAGRVVLVDDGWRLGGTGTWGAGVDPARRAVVRDLQAKVAADPRIVVLQGHTAAGLYEDRLLALMDTSGDVAALTRLRTGSVVLATGTLEQPLVFRNNDLPHVMLSGGAQTLLHRYSIACGRRVVVVSATTEGIEAALDLADAGSRIVAVVVPRGASAPSEGARAMAERCGIELLLDHEPVEAIAGADGSVAGLAIRGGNADRRLDCDALLLSAGHLPALHLALQAGGTLRWCDTLQQHVPEQLPAGVYAAGRANGVFEPAARMADGARAGRAAARGDPDAGAAELRSPCARSHPFPIYPHPRGKEFVDLDEDITLEDLRTATAEGFDSSELLKRYSTLGMGPSQGKLSHVNGLRYLAHLRGKAMNEVSLTTARPPWQGMPLGTLAGAAPPPVRKSALDAIHQALDAEWMSAGNWRRPAWYRSNGLSREKAISTEVRAVRTSAGMIDVSTLGKIDVLGPDAGALLDLLYVGRHSTQRVGTTRYAVLADEAGILVDDGVVARRGEQAWYVTATTSAAAVTYRDMQRQVLERGLDCVLHNVTGHMAAINLAGPRSRDLLARVCSDPIDEATLPYLAAADLTVCGVDARVLRVGFVGELGYEIHAPAAMASDVWQGLRAAAGDIACVPFGVEAQRVLRLEKGHVIVGQDSDALTSPDEAGLGWAVRMEKPWFVGQRSIAALRRRGARQQLIAFETDGLALPCLEGNLLIAAGEPVGRVTSVAVSPTLQRIIGLALVTPDAARAGSLHVRDDDGTGHPIRLATIPFYDPQGARQRGGDAS